MLSTYDWDLRDPRWWPQEREVRLRVARGALGIPLPWMPGLRPCVDSVPEPEHASRVDMELGVLLKSPRGVTPRLEWGDSRVLSS